MVGTDWDSLEAPGWPFVRAEMPRLEIWESNSPRELPAAGLVRWNPSVCPGRLGEPDLGIDPLASGIWRFLSKELSLSDALSRQRIWMAPGAGQGWEAKVNMNKCRPFLLLRQACLSKPARICSGYV